MKYNTSFINKFQDNLEKNDKPISTIELLAYRKEILKSKRFEIGILSSDILENPKNEIKNFKILLDFMGERSPGIYITVRKLAIVSLLEIFKDLLPSYNIVQISQEVKCMHIYICNRKKQNVVIRALSIIFLINI